MDFKVCQNRRSRCTVRVFKGTMKYPGKKGLKERASLSLSTFPRVTVHCAGETESALFLAIVYYLKRSPKAKKKNQFQNRKFYP